jgi:toxin ParE1/3/4
MREIRLSRQARDDIGQIWDYLAAQNLQIADRVLQRLDARFEVLQQFPETGVHRRDIDDTARMLIEHPYIIFYRIIPNGVQITRILHGARNIGAQSFNDEAE